MGRKTVIQMTDDLDGSEADDTIHFAFEGMTYEIDLSAANAEQMRAMFAPYISAASRAVRTTTVMRRRSRDQWLEDGRATDARSLAARRAENGQVRDWAAKHRVKLAERGRIPHAVVAAFQADDPMQVAHLIEKPVEPAPVETTPPRAARPKKTAAAAPARGAGKAAKPATTPATPPRKRTSKAPAPAKFSAA